MSNGGRRSPASLVRCPKTVVAVLAVGLLLAGCGDDDDSTEVASAPVSRAEFEEIGYDWPLDVDEGTVRCENVEAGDRVLQAATFTTDNGAVYALNGTAKSHVDAQDLEMIWSDDPDVDGLKVSVEDLLDRTLELCG